MKNLKYKFGPFIFDQDEQTLWRDGEIVGIAPKEFRVLAFFIENRHRLLSKDEIIETHWPEEFIEETTWTKSLSRLRKALGSEGKRYIQCLPRRGYRWTCPIEKISDIGYRSKADLDGKAIAVRECTERERNRAGTFSTRLRWLADHHEFTAVRLRMLAQVLESPTANATDFEVVYMLNPDQRAEFFSELARKADRELIGPAQTAWLDTLDCANDNLRDTLDHYHMRQQEAAKELEMAVSLGHFWEMRGLWTEGRDSLQRALSWHPGDSEIRARGLAWLGALLCSLDDYEAAGKTLAESVKISRQFDDNDCISMACEWLAIIAEVRGRYEEAKRHLTEGLRAGEAAKSDWAIASISCGFGRVAEVVGDIAAARQYHLKHLKLSESIGNTRGIASASANLGAIARQQGDYGAARKYQEKSLPLRASLRHRWGVADCNLQLGLIEEAVGRHRDAGNFFRQSLAGYWSIGDKHCSARALEGIGRATYGQGNEKDAARIFGTAHVLRNQIAAPLSATEQEQYGQLTVTLRKQQPGQWRDGAGATSDDVIGYSLPA